MKDETREGQMSLFDDYEKNVEDEIFGKLKIEGDSPITFRYGREGEEEVIQDIGKNFSKELGWVRLPQVRLWIKKKWCIIAECDNQIVGFNLLTIVKKKRTGMTSNNICILPGYLRRGIGRKFRQYAIELLEKKGWQTILAKCIQTSRANYLNQSMGFKLIGFDPGKKLALNIWCYYNKNIPEEYHKPDLSNQFDWSQITEKSTKELIKEEKKERKQGKKRITDEHIDSLPMEEIVREYLNSNWRDMRLKLGYSSTEISRLRKSERFKKKFPMYAKY